MTSCLSVPKASHSRVTLRSNPLLKGLLLIMAAFTAFTVLEKTDWSAYKTLTKTSEITHEGKKHLPSGSQEAPWKVVLYYTRFYGQPWNERFQEDSDLTKIRCRNTRCYFTYDRLFLDTADAILVPLNTALDAVENLKRPNKEQRWILVDLEPPVDNPYLRMMFSGYFNYTMTYHSKSDVSATYGYFFPKDINSSSNVMPLLPQLVEKKTTAYKAYQEALGRHAYLEDFMGKEWLSFVNRSKVVAWMSSHCPTESKREEYVAELQKYIPVDTYGFCGKLKCGSRSPRGSRCWKEVFRPNYLFYLSMENSLCEEYVTEKLYNPLLYGVVPVVWGGADYGKLLPPHSFIDARKHHPASLARLLQRLKENPAEYGRYHIWRYFWDVYNQANFCHLCHVLHTEKSSKYYEDMYLWKLNATKCDIIPGRLFENGTWNRIINEQHQSNVR